MKGQTYVILSIIFTIIISIFAVSNVKLVEVNFLLWNGESPLILIILFSVLMGGIVMATAGSIKIIRLQRENKAIIKQNKQMESLLNEHDLMKELKGDKDNKLNGSNKDV